jgi:hypothetical protein
MVQYLLFVFLGRVQWAYAAQPMSQQWCESSESTIYQYCLVWATRLLLAATGVIFPVLVSGHNLIVQSILYQFLHRLKNLYDYILNSYYKLLAASFLTYKLKESPKRKVLIPKYLHKFA